MPNDSVSGSERAYEFETSIPIRFRDIDAMGHVNNAVYATYLEQARTDYFRGVLDVSLADADTVLANLSIDYRRPIDPDSQVAVTLGVGELGESSIPMRYEIRTADGVAATAETVQVVIDRETGESRPVPDAWRKKLIAHRERERS